MNRPKRKLAIPSEAEIEVLKAEASPTLRGAIVVMASLGLRVGGLPGLSIYGEQYSTTTKGKEQLGVIPEELCRAGKSQLSAATICLD